MIPIESDTLGTIVVVWAEHRLDVTLFRTPDGRVGAFVELPAASSLVDFAPAKVNARICEAARRFTGKAPDFYELRHRDESVVISKALSGA